MAGSGNEGTRDRGLVRGAALAFAFWTAVGLVFALPLLARSADVAKTIASAFAQWWSWGLLAPAIISVDRALPFPASQVGKRLATHLVIGPITAVVYGYFQSFMRCVMGPDAWSRLLANSVLAEASRDMFWSMLVYCMIVGERRLGESL